MWLNVGGHLLNEKEFLLFSVPFRLGLKSLDPGFAYNPQSCEVFYCA